MAKRALPYLLFFVYHAFMFLERHLGPHLMCPAVRLRGDGNAAGNVDRVGAFRRRRPAAVKFRLFLVEPLWLEG
jgi:hypothetical protein